MQMHAHHRKLRKEHIELEPARWQRMNGILFSSSETSSNSSRWHCDPWDLVWSRASPSKWRHRLVPHSFRPQWEDDACWMHPRESDTLVWDSELEGGSYLAYYECDSPSVIQQMDLACNLWIKINFKLADYKCSPNYTHLEVEAISFPSCTLLGQRAIYPEYRQESWCRCLRSGRRELVQCCLTLSLHGWIWTGDSCAWWVQQSLKQRTQSLLSGLSGIVKSSRQRLLSSLLWWSEDH